jgi:anti-anti-sigma regulatory factor/HAMP domain-containing protein
MTVKQQIVVTVVLPIFAVFGVILGYNYWQSQARAADQVKVRVVEQTFRYANQVDALLRQLTAVATANAEFLSAEENVTEAVLYDVLNRTVQKNPLIYGSCCAFEPGVFEGRALFAPYVYRDAEALSQMDLGTAAYDYTEAEWEWFSKPKKTGKSLWTEPYFDEGAGNIHMVTFSAPFFRQGRFAGVVTVDMDLSRLYELAQIKGVAKEDFVIFSQGGKLVFYHDPVWLSKPFWQVEGQLSKTQIEKMMHTTLNGVGGVEEMGFSDEQRAWVTYAPVVSSGWVFSSRISLDAALEEVSTEGRRMAILFGLALIFATYSAWFFSARITAPIVALSRVSQQITEGDFGAHISVERKDEIGQLATNFKAMTERLIDREQSLKEINEGLESRVSERTQELEEQTQDLEKALEMSSPVTQIFSDTLLLPIVGFLDAERARDVMSRSLKRIVETKARFFIIDISGVVAIDSVVAKILINIASAVKLMGCECTLSGISPEVATQMIDLGVDLSSIITTASLEKALSRTLARNSTT